MMELEYEMIGDYYFPKLMRAEQPTEPLTKFGLLRQKFMEENKSHAWTVYIVNGSAREHCLEIQKAADERMEVLVEQMAKAENVNEELKAKDQMLWVQQMNSIRHRAEEIVLNEIVYVWKK